MEVLTWIHTCSKGRVERVGVVSSQKRICIVQLGPGIESTLFNTFINKLEKRVSNNMSLFMIQSLLV